MPQLDNTKFLTKDNKKYCFAAYPDAKVYKETIGEGWNQHLIFGDYIEILDLEIVNSRVRVRSRNKEGWIKVEKIQTERVLEINFIDIGQGDGCHVVTPDDQHILIDAGKGDNMVRYLVWRFNLYRKTTPLPFKFKAIISHSDEDHYGGFGDIFKNKCVRISEIYHNGIVQRPGEADELGEEDDGFIVGLVEDTAQMKAIIENPLKRQGTNSGYPKTLFAALAPNPDVSFKMISVKDSFLDNFNQANQVNNQEFSIEILGPITEVKNGKDALRKIGDAGKIKNGHSVLLKVKYGNARFLLGGDLNEEIGKLIVDYYKNDNKLEKLEMDVAKACHHGSHEFHYPFVQHVNAVATVISSGDDEPYSHPRPDALGALGKCGYGEKPLILSTELARSNKDISRTNFGKLTTLLAKVSKTKEEIRVLKALGALSPADEEKLKKLQTALTKDNKDINSFLTRYGMINVRTDGQKMIVAQKYERDAGYGKWDIHKLEYVDSMGRFVLK
jgi:beta-lactamase superfamily II metal-dependent hydrolase